jgi:hypothetical protein
MQTIEALIASSIFVISLLCAASIARLPLNLDKPSAETSEGVRQQEQEQEIQQAIENDRLALQAELATLPLQNFGCIPSNTILTKAKSLATPSGLQRSVTEIALPGITGTSLQVSWRRSGQSAELRRRIYTRTGLGLCR